jgi:hypothetical protein
VVCPRAARPHFDAATHFSLDEEGRLHSEPGPALAYPKGPKQYVWHGVIVPEKLILAPEKITPDQIKNEWNSEVRRVMLERYGVDRFLEAGNARTVNRDRYGRLWDLKGDRWVELRNSTREPDGKHKTSYAFRRRYRPHRKQSPGHSR